MTPSPNEFKDAARGLSADMSPEAVARRVDIMDELWEASREARLRWAEEQGLRPKAPPAPVEEIPEGSHLPPSGA